MPKITVPGKEMLALFDIEYAIFSEPITKFIMDNLDDELTLIVIKAEKVPTGTGAARPEENTTV